MKITEIFDDDAADDSPSTKPNTSTSTNNKPPPPSRSRCSSRIRRRNGTMLLGRHRSANSSLKCYEKDCCSSDEKKTPKNGKKRQSSNSTKRSNGKKHKVDLTNLDDDNMSNGTNETNLTVSAKSSTKPNNNTAKGTSGTKQLQNRRSNALGEGTSKGKGTKNDLGLAIIPLVENEDGKSRLINYIANLVEFKWNNSKRMDFIDKNFPNFRAANPELTIKLFVLMFLNICTEIGGNEEKKEECTKLMEMGKKVKELLAEVGENMEEAKFRKLSRETERALSLIFSNSIEELNDHPFRRNRRQLAETVKNALKAI